MWTAGAATAACATISLAAFCAWSALHHIVDQGQFCRGISFFVRFNQIFIRGPLWFLLAWLQPPPPSAATPGRPWGPQHCAGAGGSCRSTCLARELATSRAHSNALSNDLNRGAAMLSHPWTSASPTPPSQPPRLAPPPADESFPIHPIRTPHSAHRCAALAARRRRRQRPRHRRRGRRRRSATRRCPSAARAGRATIATPAGSPSPPPLPIPSPSPSHSRRRRCQQLRRRATLTCPFERRCLPRRTMRKDQADRPRLSASASRACTCRRKQARQDQQSSALRIVLA